MKRALSHRPSAPDGVRAWPRYPAYRESGVRWLHDIPMHWKVKPLKYAVIIDPGILPENTDPEYELAYLDIGNVDSTGNIANPELLLFGDAPSRARKHVADGDTILSTVRTYLKAIGFIENPSENLIASTGFAVLRPTEPFWPRFLFFLVQSEYFIQSVVAHSEGVSYPAINSSALGRLPVWVPDLPEQRAIADFLDREMPRIDELIAKKERLIELLQEKRTALITHAVTKGVDPDAPMKDSGVPWLGDIPAHWEAKRLKFAAKLESGHTPSRQVPEYWVDCTIPWVSLADVYRLRDGRTDLIHETSEMISELGLANSAARLLPKDTVILSRTASVGFAAILGLPMATTQDFVNWICSPSLRPRYLLQCFRAMSEEFGRLTMGSTHQTIYMPDVGRFAIPLPPPHEQDDIDGHVLRETKRIDELIDKVQQHIDKLSEFRTALISAAVTGQIAVREQTP